MLKKEIAIKSVPQGKQRLQESNKIILQAFSLSKSGFIGVVSRKDSLKRPCGSCGCVGQCIDYCILQFIPKGNSTNAEGVLVSAGIVIGIALNGLDG